MNIVKNIENVVYPAQYWWNPSVNTEATIANGLPNCTAFVIGAVSAASMPNIVSRVSDAKNWHKYLINGWSCVPFSEYKNNIKVGDVLEWVSGNHVAIVSNIDKDIWVSGSFYTGIHGKAYYNGSYDTREGIRSLKELNDFFFNKYQYRYFHYVTLETENSWCGSVPDYVLVSPMSIVPTERDKTTNQVYVGVNGLRVRTEPNTSSDVRGVASVGYYNAEKIQGGEFEDGNTWYKVNDFYIAGVQGVQYYPKEEVIPLNELTEIIKKMEESYLKVCAERDDYKSRLERIKELC